MESGGLVYGMILCLAVFRDPPSLRVARLPNVHREFQDGHPLARAMALHPRRT